MVSSTAQSVFASACPTRSNAPSASGAFPASASTARISGSSGSTTNAALCPSHRLLALFPPRRRYRAGAPTPQRGVGHRPQRIFRGSVLQGRPILPPLDVLDQQPPQQPARLQQRDLGR